MNCLTKIEKFDVHANVTIDCAVREALEYARNNGVFVEFNFNDINMLIFYNSLKTNEEQCKYFVELFKKKVAYYDI